MFFPPGQEEALRDCHGNLPYDVTAPELLDTRLYPRMQRSSLPLEVIQEAGEMIFVPSGWHHQVYNLVRLHMTLLLPGSLPLHPQLPL